MEDKYEEGLINGSIASMTMEKIDTIRNQMEKYVYKVVGNKTGTGFFCKILYEDELIIMIIKIKEDEISNYLEIDENIYENNRSLKMLAKELNVPVLTAAQLSRGVEKRGADSEPMLSDLRESGSLEQDADIVMFLHNPNAGKEAENPELDGAMKLLVKKHRHGPIGNIDLVFLKNQAQFVNAAREL